MTCMLAVAGVTNKVSSGSIIAENRQKIFYTLRSGFLIYDLGFFALN